MQNPYLLNGKVTLVTGASSGIGRATAIVCAELGSKIIATGRNKERLESLLSELNQISTNEHQLIKANLNDENEIASLIDNLPKIDCFSSNVGIVNTKLIKFAKEEDIDAIWNTNVLSHLLLFQKLAKKKKFNSKASVVFTSSIGGTSSFVPGNGIYGMSKAALDALTKYIAIEFAGKGIRCNNVRPGMIETPMTQTLGELSKEDIEKDKKSYLMNRYGIPKEVAYAIAFLLSDASSFITGQSLTIDGGFSINH